MPGFVDKTCKSFPSYWQPHTRLVVIQIDRQSQLDCNTIQVDRPEKGSSRRDLIQKPLLFSNDMYPLSVVSRAIETMKVYLGGGRHHSRNCGISAMVVSLYLLHPVMPSVVVRVYWLERVMVSVMLCVNFAACHCICHGR